MKLMKKALPLVLALAMLFTISLSALAADQTGSITIQNAVSGNTYSVYRIFDLADHNSDYSGVRYKIASKWTAFFASGANGAKYITKDAQDYVTWTTEDSTLTAANFARDAIAFATAEATKIQADATKKATSTELKFEDLALGYYLVQSSTGTLCALDTTKPDVTIKEKNSVSTLTKQVTENGTLSSSNDASIGDTVSFTAKLKVTGGSNPTHYVFHDKMDLGFTFNSTSVAITKTPSGGSASSLTANTHYTLQTSPTDGCTFEIAFAENVLAVGDEIVITYTATLNSGATVGSTGNKNSAWLTFDGNKETVKVTTKTYTWQMNVQKYTIVPEEKDDPTNPGKKITVNKEVPLQGAEFILYKKNSNNTTSYLKATESSGTYTVSGWTTTKSDATSLTTPASGLITIRGLDSEDYWLEETAAPAGYNLLAAPIKVTVDNQGGLKDANGDTISNAKVMVLNKAGAALPGTGGMGTTLFYLLGSGLTLAAGVFLLTGKRVKEEV